jgi:hypothetical protein
LRAAFAEDIALPIGAEPLIAAKVGVWLLDSQPQHGTTRDGEREADRRQSPSASSIARAKGIDRRTERERSSDSKGAR